MKEPSLKGERRQIIEDIHSSEIIRKGSVTWRVVPEESVLSAEDRGSSENLARPVVVKPQQAPGGSCCQHP